MKIAIIGCALLLASSCSVMVKTPLNRFDSPEVRGKAGGIDAYLGYQGRNEMELTPSLLLTPPTLTRPSMETPGHRLMANGAVGVSKKVDISLSLPEFRLGVKYQPFGAPHDSATAGNIPLAVSASAYSTSEEDTGGNSTSLKLKEFAYDLALITGFQINQTWLIYGGPFILWDEVKTNYRSLNAANVADLSGTLTSYGANLGAELSFGQGFLRAEFAGTKTKLGQTKSGRGTYGLALGTHF